MKKLKEFLIMFVPFVALCVLSVLRFAFNTSSDGFFGGAYLLELMLSPLFIILLLNNLVMAGVPALLLTGIFAFLIRNKKNSIGRRKYYTYLFLISLIAPVVIILILTRTFDLVNNTIYALQIGLVVVFLHWITEWIIARSKNRKKAKIE